jgi:simple sugar transport system substrate-binding protein
MKERFDRADLLRLGAGAAAVGVVPKGLLASLSSANRFPQSHPHWRFVVVNHALTNPFFVPAKNGSHDAASLLGVDVKWTGSTSSDVGQMVKAMRHAIATKADGIAISIIDPTAFNGATRLALSHGIPVISYNADGGKLNKRLAYIGQDNYQSGLELGARVAHLCSQGDVYLFIATPGQQNIQPRIDGALDALRDSGKPIRPHVVASGVDVAHERRKIEATYLANKNLRGGGFGFDTGAMAGVAQVMRKYQLHKRGVCAGGYDLLAATLRAIHDRHLDFAIDQQPYLQGFLPVLQMFLYRYSDHLVAPADTNTGLNFVTRQNVGRYLSTESRFEGSSSRERYPI